MERTRQMDGEDVIESQNMETIAIGGRIMSLNVQKFCEALSRILSNKYDAEVTVTAVKKEDG